MKITPQFPVAALSGTDRPEKKRNYYKWRDIQCSRAYHPPSYPYNESFQAGNDISALIQEQWRLLGNELKAMWFDFAAAWNASLYPQTGHYNGYTAFYTVNFYSLISKEMACLIPPSVDIVRKVYVDQVKAYTAAAPMVIVRYRTYSLPNDGYRVVIYTTPSYPYDGRAYRESECKLIRGLHPASCDYVGDRDGVNQHIIYEDVGYIDAPGWIWTKTRVLSPDGFVGPPCIVYCNTEEDMAMISVDVKTLNLGADTLARAPAGYCQRWRLSDNTLYLLSTDSVDPMYINIPLLPGSLGVKAIVTWQGVGYDDGFEARFVRRQQAAGVDDYEYVGATQVCVNPPGTSEIYVTELTAEVAEIEAGYEYALLIMSIVINSESRIYNLGIKSQARAL